MKTAKEWVGLLQHGDRLVGDPHNESIIEAIRDEIGNEEFARLLEQYK